MTSEDADADRTDGRDESVNERMDRNWNEILQELRVTQTGTQILTGFLLTMAFQPRFTDLTGFQKDVYLVLVAAAVLTTAAALAPVNLHRGLFRRHAKGTVVQTAHVILRCTLIGVGVVLVGTVVLIFDVAVGRTAAYLGGGMMLVVVALIGLLPTFLHVNKIEREPLEAESTPSSRVG